MSSFLIVDDDEVQRKIIAIKINNFGYSVIAEAQDGYDAYEKYKLHKPDYVIMDVSMPENNGVKNGIESLKLIKKFDENAQIIMISVSGEEKLLIESIINGAKTFLIKPIIEDKLKTAIELFNK